MCWMAVPFLWLKKMTTEKREAGDVSGILSSKQPQTLSKQNRLGGVRVSNSKMIKQWISNCTNEWSKAYPWLVPISMNRGAFVCIKNIVVQIQGICWCQIRIFSEVHVSFSWLFFGFFLKHQPRFRDLNWWIHSFFCHIEGVNSW